MWSKYLTSTLLLAIVISCVPSSFSDEMEVSDAYDYEYRHPFLVSIELKGLHLCTGTIIAPSWILTSASYAHFHPHQLNIKITSPNFHNPDDNVVHIKDRYFSSKVRDFNESQISLIQLREPLTFNKYVSSVVLPKEEIDLAGSFTELVGWMYFYNMTDYTNGYKAQTFDLRVKSSDECTDQLRSFWSPSEILCTTYKYDNDAQKSHPCMAYGAPLMHDKMQVGIAVPLPGTQLCDLPMYYARVSYYTTWIVYMMDRFGNK